MSLFITFEGPDGSGKSTQAQLLVESLRARGADVLLTREPGGTALGDQLRDVILNPLRPEARPLAMTLLLSASRAQLVEEVIRPALKQGQIVVADRYADSTVAYQSSGLGVPLDAVRTVTAIATGGLVPNISVYVDIEPEQARARMVRRGERDRLDALDLDFHRRVREGYRRLIEEEPERWLCVDGNAPAEDVRVAIMEAIEPRLGEVASAR